MERRLTLKCSFLEDSLEKLNSQFAKVKIRICYPGPNRNGTSFSKELLGRMAERSLKNIPIVGEWIESDENFGGHGGKIEVTEEGVSFVETTRPYGVVPENTEIFWEQVCEEPPHEYLCCTGILWVGRYPECEKILRDGSNQSMEVLVDRSHEEDGITVIDEAEFSALTILGRDKRPEKNREPCFEDAGIERYSCAAFRNDFDGMLREYQMLLNTTEKEETDTMEEKIVSALRLLTYQSPEGTKAERYLLLSCRDGEIDVMDRADNYSVFSCPYESGEDKTVTFRWEEKTPRSLVCAAESDNGVLVGEEIASVREAAISFARETFESQTVEELTSKLMEAEKALSDLQQKYEAQRAQLDAYEKARAEKEALDHRAAVDAKLEEYADKMGRFSEYLLYRSKVDYSKSVEQIDVDMLMLLGKYSKGRSKKYGYVPTEIGVSPASEAFVKGSDRYGDLFEKIGR